MKKAFVILLTLVMCLSVPVVTASAGGAAGNTDAGESANAAEAGRVGSVDVYVTISSAGTLAAAKEKIAVTDIDSDGALTISDALYCAHESLYEGGADAGYAANESQYGLSLSKLWGVENGGSYNYYVNNASASSLADPVKEGDYIAAYSYADLTAWSDAYAYFDVNSAETSPGEAVTLTLSYNSYDENWNLAPLPCAGATVTAGGKEYTTDAEGKVTLTFDEAGSYIVTAYSEAVTLVPPVCAVEVRASSDAVGTWGDGQTEDATSQGLPASAASENDLDSAMEKAAAHVLSQAAEPGYGSHWLMLALCLGDFDLPDGYQDSYYAAMADYVSSCDGVLSTRKYTEYSSAILGITAAGFNASDVAGYDLTAPLSDYDATKLQGLNGPLFALLALDSGDYPCQTRQDYVDYLLSRQLEDGGWAISGDAADADMTAMALQALARYQDRQDVLPAVGKGIDRLSLLQGAGGGYASYGTESVESTAQAIIALCELGIPLDDPRFVKNGHTALDSLLTYQNSDGSFSHIQGDPANGVATQQAFAALVAAKRQADGLGGVYRMDQRYEQPKFRDVSGHWAEESILYCVENGLIQGTGQREFSPNLPMTRAALVTALWQLAGAPEGGQAAVFSDVSPDAGCAGAIAWASANGIVEGYPDGSFGVNDPTTRQELAVFLYRYAGHTGAEMSASGSLDGFPDADAASSWAEDALCWATGEGLVASSTDGYLLPREYATRAEAASSLMKLAEDAA